jgi:hypothetical protein
LLQKEQGKKQSRCEILEKEITEKIKSELTSEIQFLEGDYEIIKNFLKGVEYDINQIRTVLQSFKDQLSKVRSLLLAYFQLQGKNFDFQTRPVLDNIDIALVLIEANPPTTWKNARVILQLSLAVSNVKIEDVMSFISTIRKSAL